jgi:hypothetical protein
MIMKRPFSKMSIGFMAGCLLELKYMPNVLQAASMWWGSNRGRCCAHINIDSRKIISSIASTLVTAYGTNLSQQLIFLK